MAGAAVDAAVDAADLGAAAGGAAVGMERRAARQPALKELMRAWLRVGAAGAAASRAVRGRAALGGWRGGAAAGRAGGGRGSAAAGVGRGRRGVVAEGWRLAVASPESLAASASAAGGGGRWWGGSGAEAGGAGGGEAVMDPLPRRRVRVEAWRWAREASCGTRASSARGMPSASGALPRGLWSAGALVAVVAELEAAWALAWAEFRPVELPAEALPAGEATPGSLPTPCGAGAPPACGALSCGSWSAEAAVAVVAGLEAE